VTAVRRLVAAWLVRRVVLRVDPGHPVVVQHAAGLEVQCAGVTLARISPGSIAGRRYGPERIP
jgi:hypothetical protein